MKFKLFIFFFITLVQTSVFAVSDPIRKTDALARAFMKENKVGGMSIAILDKGKTYILNYGYANEINKTPTTNDTIYTIASFTKTFTATLAAIAAVEHKLNLDSPFINYFPEVKNNKNLSQITSSELLGHVSSFPFDFEPRPKTYSEAIASLNQYKLSRAPGTEYSYSNAGIGTMGYVLQNVYAKKYQAILAAKILQPLNMTSTYLEVPISKQNNMALGHEKNNEVVPYSNNIETWFAAASLKSTISDMAKYLNAHINYTSNKDDNFFKALSLVHENKYCLSSKVACEQLAWQAHIISELNKSTGDTYFLDYDNNGMPIFSTMKIIKNKNFSENRIFIDKTGSGYGMSSYMIYLPDEKIGVVLLINKNIGNTRITLARNILETRMKAV